MKTLLVAILMLSGIPTMADVWLIDARVLTVDGTTNYAVLPTGVGLTNALTPLNATNALNASLRNGSFTTNIGNIGKIVANGSMVTNGALIWFTTNATPTTVLPNGSLCTVTDGRLFVRTNSTWLAK